MAMTPQLKVTKAKTQLVMEYPFFGCLALRLITRETREIPTLATDGVSLYYNPEYVDKMDMELVRSAIAHEVMHCALAHPLRRYNRDPMRWNLATDYAINPILKDSGFKLHESWLIDPEYFDMDADTIYNKLPEPKVIKLSGCGMLHDHPMCGGGMSDGDGDGKDKKKGKGGGKDGDKDKKGPGGIGHHMSEADIRKAESEAKIVLAQAAAVAKMQGKLPASLERMVENIVNPKVDWRQKLRRFLEEISKNDYAWIRPNRKLIASGVYMPGLYSLEVGEVVIAIDTSGSISPKELDAFAAEVSSILESVTPKMIHVIYCDADIAGEVEHYDKFDLPLNLKARGGGGTDFRPPFDWVEKEQMLPKCLIYFTDMCCSSYPEEPHYPVMWMSTSESYRNPPFGEVAVLEL